MHIAHIALNGGYLEWIGRRKKKKSKNANGQRNDKVILTLNTYSHNKGYTIR